MHNPFYMYRRMSLISIILSFTVFSCSFQFKAKPFNPKIITLQGRLGVPVIERKPLTHPKVPMLTIELKTKKPEEGPMKKEFRARPLPKGILEGVKVSVNNV